MKWGEKPHPMKRSDGTQRNLLFDPVPTDEMFLTEHRGAIVFLIQAIY